MTAYYFKGRTPRKFLTDKLKEYFPSVIIIGVADTILYFAGDKYIMTAITVLTLAFCFGIEIGRYISALEMEKRVQ